MHIVNVCRPATTIPEFECYLFALVFLFASAYCFIKREDVGPSTTSSSPPRCRKLAPSSERRRALQGMRRQSVRRGRFAATSKPASTGAPTESSSSRSSSRMVDVAASFFRSSPARLGPGSVSRLTPDVPVPGWPRIYPDPFPVYRGVK